VGRRSRSRQGTPGEKKKVEAACAGYAGKKGEWKGNLRQGLKWCYRTSQVKGGGEGGERGGQQFPLGGKGPKEGGRGKREQGSGDSKTRGQISEQTNAEGTAGIGWRPPQREPEAGAAAVSRPWPKGGKNRLRGRRNGIVPRVKIEVEGVGAVVGTLYGSG